MGEYCMDGWEFCTKGRLFCLSLFTNSSMRSFNIHE